MGMMAVAQPAPVMAMAGAVVAQPQVVVQPVVMAPMPIVMFGRLPVLNTCQFCHQSGPTNVRYEPGMGTHAAAVCCCVPWIGIPLCCIPYMVDGMKDAKHTCAFCARQVGEKKLIG